MTAGQGYPTKYSFKIDTSVFPVVLQQVKGEDVMVPHSNIHSCIRSRGACTPFVGNTPGLSTHTAALVGNLSSTDGSHLLDEFSTEMKLTTGSYTVIAHTRFFIPDVGQDSGQSCYPSCLTKVDTAVGILREVIEPEVSTSTDAYVGTGVIGACMLLAGISVVWGARSGRLDLDAILTYLTRDEIVFTVDMLIGVGDVIAFTIGFKEEVLADNNLKDIVPAAVLFLVTGWISSLCAAWQNVKQLKVVIERDWNTKKYFETQAQVIVKASRSEEDVVSVCSSRSRLATSARGQTLIREREQTRGHLFQLYMNAITLAFADLPLTAIGIYIIMKGDSVEAAVVMALCAATMMVGAKAHGLVSFSEQRMKVKVATKNLEVFLAEEKQGGVPDTFSEGELSAKDAEAQFDLQPEEEEESSIAQKRPKSLQPSSVSKWRANTVAPVGAVSP